MTTGRQPLQRAWLEAELDDQPAALRRLLEEAAPAVDAVADLLRRNDVRYVVIAARGSSGNAARYAQYLLGRARRIPVMFATPSLYTIYGQPPRLDGAVVVGISQSGASPDVVSVLAEGRRQGRPTVALTNSADSPLAQVASVVIPLSAGDELAVAATKTYVNSLGAIAMLFAALDGDRATSELAEAADRLEEQLALTKRTLPALDGYSGIHGGTVVSRGINYGTAYEVALKIRELSGLVMEAYSPADLLHGPIAAIHRDWPVVVVAPSGPAFDSMRAIVEPLRDRGARIVVISDDRALLGEGTTALPLVDRLPEWLSPLTAVVPGQFMGLALARARELDVDRPLGLSKVTLTR
jgi:glucosamine--fructose-6-phosphate aminotransferase (isomerizing)